MHRTAWTLSFFVKKRRRTSTLSKQRGRLLPQSGCQKKAEDNVLAEGFNTSRHSVFSKSEQLWHQFGQIVGRAKNKRKLFLNFTAFFIFPLCGKKSRKKKSIFFE
jgi:hypothetical protein